MHVVQVFLISLGAYPPCCLTGRRNQIRMFWGPLVPAVTVPPLEGHVIPSLWELCSFFILSCLYYYYYIQVGRIEKFSHMISSCRKWHFLRPARPMCSGYSSGKNVKLLCFYRYLTVHSYMPCEAVCETWLIPPEFCWHENARFFMSLILILNFSVNLSLPVLPSFRCWNKLQLMDSKIWLWIWHSGE